MNIQVLDQGHVSALRQPSHEFFHAFVDDHLCIDHGGLSVDLAAVDHFCEVVHGVQINIAKVFDLGLDVTRHRQIDHEDGFVFSGAQSTFNGAKSNQGQGAGSATDHNVKLVQALGQICQGDASAAVNLRQQVGSFSRSVGNRD